MTTVFPAGIRFTIDTILDDDAIDACFIQINSEILCYVSEDNETEVQAGELEAYIIDVNGAQELGYGVSDVFDQMQESYEYYALLFDEESSELSGSFLSDFDEAMGRNFLILHRLEIRPNFRHARLGLAAISRATDVFGYGCGYAILKAMPLQFKEITTPNEEQWFQEMRLPEFPGDEEQARRKLQEYYALLGFRPVAGTPWMALNLSYVRPRLGDNGWA